MICIEKLSCLILKMVEDNKWNPIYASIEESGISHLFCIDDIFIFTQGTTSQVGHVNIILFCVCRVLRMKVNYNKSIVTCSNLVSKMN